MSNQSSQLSTISIANIMRGVWHRKLLILSCLTLGVLGALGLLAISKPQYASEAHIIVSDLTTPYDKANNVQEQRREAIDDRFVLSQVSVLKSEDLLHRALKNLSLIGKGEFEPLANGIGAIKGLAIALGFSDDPRLMTPDQRALKHAAKQLVAYQEPLSNVLVVRYSASNGKTAADMANNLAETFVLTTRESQSGPNNRAREWLGSQIQGLRNKVAESEAKVEDYRIKAGLLRGQTNTLGTQEISELNSQITLAEASSSEASARADEIAMQLETTGSVDSSIEVLNSPVVQRLREQQVIAAQKISQLSATYLPNHPKMKAATREAADVDRQVRREAIKIVDGLRGQAKIAAARASSLRASLEQLKGREGNAAQSEVGLKELQREAEADRALLETMLSRYADANARQDLNLQPGFARIIQHAAVPASPYFPKVGPVFLLFSLAGLGLGLGLAFLAEIMAQASRVNEIAAKNYAQLSQRNVHVAQNSEQPIVVPALSIEQDQQRLAAMLRGQLQAATPAAAPLPQIIASMPMAPSLVAAFAMLETAAASPMVNDATNRIANAIADTAGKDGTKVFGFASVGGTFDSALTTVVVARALAGAKCKTMVLDVSGARPSLTDLMTLGEGPGLTDIVNGSVDVARVVQRDPKSNVQMIRFGQHYDMAARDALAAKMPSILAAMTQVYDVVLINAGEAAPHTPALLQGSGAVFFLSPATRQRDAVVAARSLTAKNIHQSYFIKLDQIQENLQQAS